MTPLLQEPDPPSSASHIFSSSNDRRLKVIIIGAGIAGLSAAIGLRYAGHDVEIFEQSSFANEIGAAIHVCPNASRIVLKWGLDPVKACFDIAQSGLTAHASTLSPIYEADWRSIGQKYRSPWYLAHRVDLHNSLKELALQTSGNGTPCRIHLRSKVVAINSKTAAIALADATTHTADIIVAADGVHSLAVKQVTGFDTPALPTGQSAFRFLIPTNDILTDEQTKHFLEDKDGNFKIYVGGDGRRLVWYPCRAGTIQNFVGIHPDNERFAAIEDWNISANKSDLLQEFQSFHPDLIATMKKATDIKLWKLLYRPPLPIWHRERLVLIGDAAHPMLPNQGQAGAQSIEDGAAIGTLFSSMSADLDLNKDIQRRLEAFETVRRERASLMQIFSNAGQEESEKVRDEAVRLFGPGIRVPSGPAEFHEFNFGHDVVKESKRLLQELHATQWWMTAGT